MFPACLDSASWCPVDTDRQNNVCTLSQAHLSSTVRDVLIRFMFIHREDPSHQLMTPQIFEDHLIKLHTQNPTGQSQRRSALSDGFIKEETINIIRWENVALLE